MLALKNTFEILSCKMSDSADFDNIRDDFAAGVIVRKVDGDVAFSDGPGAFQ